MSEPTHTSSVGVAETPSHSSQPGFLTADVTIVILTWITFFSLLAILHKFAWKPILAGLDKREEEIRSALDNAQKAKEELEKIEKTRAQRIAEADLQAKDVVDRSRQAAVEAARAIDRKAKEEAQILLKNAHQEISAQTEKARRTLREESVNVAVGLAEKILQEELDDKKHQKLIDRLIKDFHPDEGKK